LNIPFIDPNNGSNRPGIESLNGIISAAHNAFDDDDCDDHDRDDGRDDDDDEL
jgi:hypothetical protein